MKHVLLIVVLSTFIMGIVGCKVPYQDESCTVGSLSTSTMTLTMSKGDVLEGYLTVRGGNDDIGFYIKDSYGNKVMDIGVNGRYDFSYTATSEGFHTLYFDNGFSLFTRKQIFIHYRVR